MSTPTYSFTSEPANRFPLQLQGHTLGAKINLESGNLQVTSCDGVTKDFPLVLNGEPHPHAVYITQAEGCPSHLEIGTANFGNQALYLENYELNGGDFKDVWSLNLADGHVGMLDLRNLNAEIHTEFFLRKVPVLLSISGIYLRVTTIKVDPSSGLEPWYVKSNL